MNGLKKSGRLISVNQEFADESDPGLVPVYRMLAADRVNIAFLYANYLNPEKRITCLVEQESLIRPGSGITGPGRMPANSDKEASSGLVSVFPHRFSPAAAGSVVRTLSGNDISWNCMASSGSMLSFVCGHELVDRAAGAIAAQLGVPDYRGPGLEHDPIARSLRTSPETVARYVEPRIRTYGIESRTGLSLLRLVMDPDAIGKWALQAAENGLKFCYASAENNHGGTGVMLDMVVDTENMQGRGKDILFRFSEKGSHGPVETVENAGMISFYGPHFGDRYGIADKALGGLSRAGIPVWLAGCVGATVSMVMPHDAVENAEKALSEAFESP
ncbi:MAG: hypothetical protein ACLFML_04315 [Desulfobacterales bacterium]